MNHAPYFREGTESTAILMVHGIVGSPGHFRDLVPVVPKSFALYNLLLDGHAGTVLDFGRSSMEKWKAQVKNTLDDLLSRYETVGIIAHSMGTFFAIQAALDHPDRIAFLFLLSVPTRPWVRVSTMFTSIRMLWGAKDPAARAMREDTAITLTRKLWQYLTWIPRYLELFSECRRIRGVLPGLAVPTQVFQSRTDQLVSFRSCKDWAANPAVTTTVLLESGHFAYSAGDTRLLQTRLAQTLDTLKNRVII